MDYGSDKKLRLHSAGGVITPPATPRGLTPAQKFANILGQLLQQDDVVVESPTVGSSGAETYLIRDVVDNSSHTLYLLPARAVKNYAKDNDIKGLGNKGRLTDAQCASIIYDISQLSPKSLRVWHYNDNLITRKYSSVRPYDKRNYKDPEVDRLLSLLPSFSSLQPDMQALLGNGRKRTPDYKPARVLPFAMALEEPGSETRTGYEKILGLYGHGYPSFYRRASIGIMKLIAQRAKGVKSMSSVTKKERKEAWKQTRHIIRRLYSMSAGTP